MFLAESYRIRMENCHPVLLKVGITVHTIKVPQFRWCSVTGKSATSGRAGGMRKAPRRGLLCRRSLICIKNFFFMHIFIINTYD